MTNDSFAAVPSRRAIGFHQTLSFIFCAALLLVLFAETGRLSAASQCRTENFIVTAANADLANRVAQCAEESRVRLARLWLGVELPTWTTPCPIKVKSGPGMGAGGETTFTFVGDAVTGWKMSVQGTEERILDSVVPHEVSHTIFATYFCSPVPRWIDEGAATSVEADVERSNYRNMLIGFLQENRGIPFNTMVRLTEYPRDMMPFYSQGFSVCEYLLAVGGHRRLVEFTRDAMQSGDWSASVKKFYGYEDLSDLQIRWTNWISAWHNAGHPARLPAVAKVADYPYDIHGRPIGGGAAAPTAVAMNSVVPAAAAPRTASTVNPLNSFVAMPRSRYNIEDEDFSAAFNDGAGSASPSEFLGLNAGPAPSAPAYAQAENNVYQGTYGHRGGTPEPGYTPAPAPAAGVYAQAGGPYDRGLSAPPMGPPSGTYPPAPDYPAPMPAGSAPTILGQSPF